MKTLDLIKQRIAEAEQKRNRLLAELNEASFRADEVMNAIQGLREIQEALEAEQPKLYL